MIDRADLYARWLSVSLHIGTRAAGSTQNLQPDTITGSHAIKSAPNAEDWIERRELVGGMTTWLESMNPIDARKDEQMHEAITRASTHQLDNLIGKIERAEWLLKIKWDGNGHRNLKASEADLHGKQEWERRIIEDFIGVSTRAVADEYRTSYESIRWIRRKHGIDNAGNREYPCTIAALNACPVCQKLGRVETEYAA